MVERETLIRQLNNVVEKLEYHLQKYKGYKSQFQHSKSSKAKNKALENMAFHAKYMLSTLLQDEVLKIIENGNQFQFEDFTKYAASDVTDYIKKIKEYIEKLQQE